MAQAGRTPARAEQGRRQLRRALGWARRHMPIADAECERLPDLTGVRLACALHLDLKLIPALESVLERGATVFVLPADAATVRDEVVAYLRGLGVQTHAWQGMSAADQHEGVRRALEWGPTHTCESGAPLTVAAGEREGGTIRAGLEATAAGIARIQDLRLQYPVFSWHQLRAQEALRNRYLVGVSTWQTFCQRTQLSLHGRHVVVVGFGLVGQGLAEAARAFGGVVSVVEHDPVRRLEAAYAGWRSGSLDSLAPEADLIVTATGRSHVLTTDLMRTLRSGCFLLNVGDVRDEIDVDALTDSREVIPFVEQCRIGDRQIYLFAGGAMANLAAGQGESLNAFDLTLAIMVAGIGLIVSPELRWPPGVHGLPDEVWHEPARRAARRAAPESA